MQTKTVNVYSFSELTPIAQARAHQDYINQNDYSFLSECMNERLHELLKENDIQDLNDTSKTGTKPTNVMYSLSCSQGDGAMFEGEFIWKGYSVTIKHYGKYYHCNSKRIEIVKDNAEGLSMDADDTVYAEFESIYKDICHTLETFGYNFIDNENSLESFIEVCEANDYTFLKDGKLEN